MNKEWKESFDTQVLAIFIWKHRFLIYLFLSLKRCPNYDQYSDFGLIWEQNIIFLFSIVKISNIFGKFFVNFGKFFEKEIAGIKTTN